MSYKNADEIFPSEILEIIQQYIDGEYIYIPRKQNKRKKWGESTTIREELNKRNIDIWRDYKTGLKTNQLANKYFLSEKSIQRIVKKMKYI